MKKVNGKDQPKNKSDTKKINHEVSKFERVMRISDNEIIAKAIRDILIRDKEL